MVTLKINFKNIKNIFLNKKYFKNNRTFSYNPCNLPNLNVDYYKRQH
jgi:hypothetical protein